MFFLKWEETPPELYYPQNEVEIWLRDTYVLWSYVYCFDWEFIGGCERDEFNRKDMKKMLAREWDILKKQHCIDAVRVLQVDGIANKDGWDLCRAMQILACSYIAGFYNRVDYNTRAIEIAKIIQNTFNSWDEMVESYLKGLEEWGIKSLDEPDAYLIIRERRHAYNLLKVQKKPPYSVDWQLDLTID